MAAAIATVNTDLSKMHAFGNMYIVTGNLVIDPGPATYTSGGIVVNWGSLVKSSKQPIFFGFTPTYAMAGSSPEEGVYVLTIPQLDPTQSISDCTLVICASGTESTGGDPVSSDVTGTPIPFLAIFQGQL